MKPLCIDLFCGLGGWAEGFLSEGYDVIGFDIERRPYPGQLVLQDVLTLHGSHFRDAAIIVASPPCTEYSYMAMPWSRGKQIAAALRGQGAFPADYTGSRNPSELNALFDACFRIQREASEAAGHYIPLVVENVKGAQPWVGQAKANYGSYYLWGDVANVGGRIVRSGPVQFGMASVKANGRMKQNPDGTQHPIVSWFAIADSKNRGASERKSLNGSWDQSRENYNPDHSWKNNGGSWFAVAHNTDSGHSRNPVNDSVKNRDTDGYERDHPNGFGWKAPRTTSHCNARREASALIAKIPFALARHVARCFKP